MKLIPIAMIVASAFFCTKIFNKIDPTPTRAASPVPSLTVEIISGSPAAKAVRASGTVTVQITVDEKGNVTSATPVSGYPLLRPSALLAAYETEFEPTVLSGKAVKVTGMLTFNFTPD